MSRAPHITPQDRQLAERILNHPEVNASDEPHSREVVAALLAEAREAQHKASWAEDKLTEAYATGFRNGRASVLGIEANGACYVGIDDSILRVDAKLTENTFRIEVFQKRHGDHWTRLQEMTGYEIHQMEVDRMKQEFDVRKKLTDAGIGIYPSTYDGDGDILKIPNVKTNI